MHPDHPVGTLGRHRQLHDRDRRRVRREHDLGSRDLAERAEDRELRVHVFRGRLDHQIRRRPAPARSVTPSDAAEQRVGLGGSELPALDRLADRTLDRGAAAGDQLLVALDERDVGAGPRERPRRCRSPSGRSPTTPTCRTSCGSTVFPCLPALSGRKPTIQRMGARRRLATLGVAVGGVLVGSLADLPGRGAGRRHARRRSCTQTGHAYLGIANDLALVPALAAIAAHVHRAALDQRPVRSDVAAGSPARVVGSRSARSSLMEVLERVTAGAPLAELIRTGMLPIGVAAQVGVGFVAAAVDPLAASHRRSGRRGALGRAAVPARAVVPRPLLPAPVFVPRRTSPVRGRRPRSPSVRLRTSRRASGANVRRTEGARISHAHPREARARRRRCAVDDPVPAGRSRAHTNRPTSARSIWRSGSGPSQHTSASRTACSSSSPQRRRETDPRPRRHARRDGLVRRTKRPTRSRSCRTSSPAAMGSRATIERGSCPTQAGAYTFHFTGTVHGTKIDQSFAGGTEDVLDRGGHVVDHVPQGHVPGEQRARVADRVGLDENAIRARRCGEERDRREDGGVGREERGVDRSRRSPSLA